MKNWIFFILSIALFAQATFGARYNLLENLSKSEDEFNKAVEKYSKDLNNFHSKAVDLLDSKYKNYIRNLVNAYTNEMGNIDSSVLLSMAGPKTKNKCNSTASNIDDDIYFKTKIGIEKCLSYSKELFVYDMSAARSLESYLPEIKNELQNCQRMTTLEWKQCLNIKFRHLRSTIQYAYILDNSTDVIRSLEKQYDECSMSHYVKFTETITSSSRDLQSCLTPPEDITLLKQYRQ
ncbi:hypothetical protein HCN44_005515 [Aphidius gifuensis]|uniref:Venom protein n=1 Tax=Aphidius gifuensis TaxID=684658 RepID=A0A834Y4Y3_APHGI|nr:uncharacterized protein LOC122847751 [Aphidius gifuensis]KAF7997238.1 hypothetical protein HCN44_005515 [Aphidius gifuensis]